MLVASGLLLATPSATSTAGALTGPRVSTSVLALPTPDHAAASSMLALVLYEGQHLGAATAMVLPPGRLAVTTTPIPPGTTVMGRAYGGHSMVLTVVGTDRTLGITVLRLPEYVPVTPVASLEASLATGGGPTSFTALAAVRGATTPVQFEYAPAYLSSLPAAVCIDALRPGQGAVGCAAQDAFELSFTQGRSLTGTIAGTVVLNGLGEAVAAEVPVLGETDFVSTDFLRLLAQRLVNGSSGHGWLQFAACSPTAPNTPCGGRLVPYGVVTVVNVALHGASSGRIRTGDRVVSINSVPVTSAAEIGSAEYTSSPGQVVNIAVSRNGRTIDLNVRLAAHP